MGIFVLRVVVFGFMVSLGVSAKAAERLVSAVVGTVGDLVVTTRDIQLEGLVDAFISGGSKNQLSLSFFEVGETAQQKEFYRSLIERAISIESQTFSVSQLNPEESKKIEKAVLDSMQNSETQKKWSSLSAGISEIREVIERKQRTKKLIEFKISSTRLPVSEADALRYFQSNKARFGDAPFAQFRDQIKTLISKQLSDERMKEWVQVLARKYKIQKKWTL